MLVRSWIDALKARFTRQPTRRERRAAGLARPLHVESLEDRRLMAFDPSVNYPVGQLPISGVAAGLINGDTALDRVTANNSDNTVSVLLNQGTGSFAAAASYPVGPSPFDVATGDFNRDGRADVVTANYVGNNVSVLLNQANGTLGTSVSYAAGTAPTSVAVEDLNGDSKLDLAVTNYNNSNTETLLILGVGLVCLGDSFLLVCRCFVGLGLLEGGNFEVLFPRLMSRWMIPLVWACWIAWQTEVNSASRSRIGSWLSSQYWVMGMPRTSSMTK